jgi:pimeloyl-ACP methyl ester carboxylesterase
MITTSDGIRLEVRTIGTGTPLVFVHEFSGDARSWERQVSFFAHCYRCTTYCARGYPPSDIPAAITAYDQTRAAEDVADVVRSVANGPAHVVGLSMGGFAALHCALIHPELVRSLVIAGVGYGAKPEQQPQYGDAMRAEADHAEAIGMEKFARELAESPYAQGLRAKNERGWRLFAEQLAEHSAQGMAMTLRGILATRPSLWHLADRLKALSVPVLLVTGDEDTPCLEPNLFLKTTLPDAALWVVPRTSHLINLEEPALFNSTIFSFLVAVDSGHWRAWRGGKPGASEGDQA